MIRLIVASTVSGEREEVIFTEDMVTPADELFFMGEMTVDIDDKTIEDLPSGFPMNYVLVKARL